MADAETTFQLDAYIGSDPQTYFALFADIPTTPQTVFPLYAVFGISLGTTFGLHAHIGTYPTLTGSLPERKLFVQVDDSPDPVPVWRMNMSQGLDGGWSGSVEVVGATPPPAGDLILTDENGVEYTRLPGLVSSPDDTFSAGGYGIRTTSGRNYTDPMTALRDSVILSELMPDISAWADDPCPIPLEAIGLLPPGVTFIEDVHTETGYYPWGRHPTNLDIAEAAVEAAGYSLLIIHNTLMDEIVLQEVDQEYSTLDKTVGTILDETILKGGGRTWIDGGTLWVDFRAVSGPDAASDSASASWAGAVGLTAAESARWRHEQQAATYSEPAPVLQDFLDECNEEPSTLCDGTFETLANGVYSYDEEHGVDFDRTLTRYTITKSNGKVISEIEQRFGYLRGQFEAKWAEVWKSVKLNQYDPNCDDALVLSTEEVTVRRQDFVWWDLTLDSSITSFSYGRPLDDWLPESYIQSYRITSQQWHPEGWLKGREEVTYELASIVQTVFGSTFGSPNYSKSYRKELYLPIGRGLWLNKVTESSVAEKVVWEREDAGATPNVEPLTILPTTQVVTNSIIQDGPPPTVACKSDCIDQATEDYEEALRIHTARLRYGRALTVTTLDRSLLEIQHHLGQIVGSKVVVGVSHSYELPVDESVRNTSTTVTLWEYA